MICSKCQLPTAEADLKDATCGPCRGEVPCGETETKLLNPPGFGAMMAKARKEYKDAFVAAALSVAETSREIWGPVVSPQPKHRPGRRLYGLEYRLGSVRGSLSFTSVEAVERTIRATTGNGGEILRVVETQELLPDEYGGVTELVVMGEWSRERIESVAKKSGIRVEHHARHAGLTAVLKKARDLYDPVKTEEPPRDRNRRVKSFGVSRDRVLQFLTRGCRYVTGEIPADAEVMDVRDDWERRMFVFMLRHDSFPPVPEGQVPEMIRPV